MIAFELGIDIDFYEFVVIDLYVIYGCDCNVRLNLYFQRFYIVTSNQMRRIMSVRTSPLYSHFAETVAGASTVRAFDRQGDFIEESDGRIERMQMAKFPSFIIDR